MNYSHEPERKSGVNEPDLSGTYTARDYLSWQVDELMELINGKIFKMSPGPTSWHQMVFSELHYQLKSKFRPDSDCKLWLAPLDVYLVHPGEDYLETRNVVEPDLFIVCDHDKITRRGCIGAPDFVVEILSPGTRKKDATLKLDLYERYKVSEYWMISLPDRLVIRNLLNAKGKYEALTAATEGAVISPRAFPELEVDLSGLFQDLPEEL